MRDRTPDTVRARHRRQKAPSQGADSLSEGLGGAERVWGGLTRHFHVLLPMKGKA